MNPRMKDEGRRLALSASEGMMALLLALGALLLLASIVGAQAGASPGALTSLPSALLGTSGTGSASYDLSWWTMDGGGTMFSTGGSYSLGGAIGQPDAGTLSGGGYTLVGGFWGGAAVQYKVLLPLVLKQ